MLLPKFQFVHAMFLASAVPTWLDLVGIIILGIAFVYFFIGWLRASYKHDHEKEAHRRFGGTAPKK